MYMYLVTHNLHTLNSATSNLCSPEALLNKVAVSQSEEICRNHTDVVGEGHVRPQKHIPFGREKCHVRRCASGELPKQVSE